MLLRRGGSWEFRLAVQSAGSISEMNVVPLIDILLVLLVIFMIIPHRQTGLKAEIPQPAPPVSQPQPEPDIVVVQVLDGGSYKLTSKPLRGRLCAAGWKRYFDRARTTRLSFAAMPPSSFR